MTLHRVVGVTPEGHAFASRLCSRVALFSVTRCRDFLARLGEIHDHKQDAYSRRRQFRHVRCVDRGNRGTGQDEDLSPVCRAKTSRLPAPSSGGRGFGRLPWLEASRNRLGQFVLQPRLPSVPIRLQRQRTPVINLARPPRQPNASQSMPPRGRLPRGRRHNHGQFRSREAQARQFSEATRGLEPIRF